LKKSRAQGILVLAIIGFFAVIIFISVSMTLKNTDDLMSILEDSIESGLISASIAARGHIDVERFDSYNSVEDIKNDWEAYQGTLEELRTLKRQIGVDYIYALKYMDGNYYFVFDTDEESDTLLDEYEIYPVHKLAFEGKDVAGIMNLVDEYGSFNTGAVPIWKNGEVIGIISTDIEDMYIQESNSAANRNAAVLIVTLCSTMGALTLIVSLLLRNVRKAQDELFRMANHDVLTGLYNRQYLLSYLSELVGKTKDHKTTFALLLMDLDNFKSVNDNAGHDAGDELLCRFAKYLDSVHEGVHENSKSFRPPAGALNVSARIGGDEFVQVIPGISTAEEAERAAKEVLDNFSEQTAGRYVKDFHVGLSIGVALFPEHTENFNVLIKYADIAMYYTKKHGKNSYCIYNSELSQAAPDEDKEQHEKRFPADRRQRR